MKMADLVKKLDDFIMEFEKDRQMILDKFHEYVDKNGPSHIHDTEIQDFHKAMADFYFHYDQSFRKIDDIRKKVEKQRNNLEQALAAFVHFVYTNNQANVAFDKCMFETDLVRVTPDVDFHSRFPSFKGDEHEYVKVYSEVFGIDPVHLLDGFITVNWNSMPQWQARLIENGIPFPFDKDKMYYKKRMRLRKKSKK